MVVVHMLIDGPYRKDGPKYMYIGGLYRRFD